MNTQAQRELEGGRNSLWYQKDTEPFFQVHGTCFLQAAQPTQEKTELH